MRSVNIILAVLVTCTLMVFGSTAAVAAPAQGWVRQVSGVTDELSSVSAVSADVAWAVGANGCIVHTIDGGTTWTKQETGVPLTIDLTGVDALNGVVAWAVGNQGTALWTATGGAIWNEVANLPPGIGNLQDVKVLNANTIWIVGYDGTILKTTNGGLNWTNQSVGGHDLWSIDATDTNHAFAVGSGGAVWRTINGGTNWTACDAGTTRQIHGVIMSNQNTPWAVGYEGTVVKSSNSGADWVKQPSPFYDILSGLSAADADVAWAIGYNDFSVLGGMIMRTDNGGGYWYKQPIPTVGDLNGVSAVDADTAWACGARGAILKTENGGEMLTTWYLAEGSTAWGFDTYVTIENPNDAAVTAAVTYQTRDGERTRPDILLPAQSQTVISPGSDIGATDFSTKVECKEGMAICVDRRMMWTGPHSPYEESHCSVGVAAPDTTWYLAEGSSNWGFECWLLIQNPNNAEATCQVSYMIEGEGETTKTHKVAANSRATFNMFDDIGVQDASIRVNADLPVIPERAMYRYDRREGHTSIGTINPSSNYYLAEGCTSFGFTTFVLVQNPHDSATDVFVTFMTTAGPVNFPAFRMDPNTRWTINVNSDVVLPDPNFSTQVVGSQPIIAERAMYWDRGYGETCHDSIGMPSPYPVFYLPDGESNDKFETWTLVQNPNPNQIQVEISYFTPSGAGNVTRTETIPANSRRTYDMGQHSGLTGRAAIMVVSKTAGNKIMVERAMYWPSAGTSPSLCRGAGTDTIGGGSNLIP